MLKSQQTVQRSILPILLCLFLLLFPGCARDKGNGGSSASPEQKAAPGDQHQEEEPESEPEARLPADRSIDLSEYFPLSNNDRAEFPLAQVIAVGKQGGAIALHSSKRLALLHMSETGEVVHRGYIDFAAATQLQGCGLWEHEPSHYVGVWLHRSLDDGLRPLLVEWSPGEEPRHRLLRLPEQVALREAGAKPCLAIERGEEISIFAVAHPSGERMGAGRVMVLSGKVEALLGEPPQPDPVLDARSLGFETSFPRFSAVDSTNGTSVRASGPDGGQLWWLSNDGLASAPPSQHSRGAPSTGGGEWVAQSRDGQFVEISLQNKDGSESYGEIPAEAWDLVVALPMADEELLALMPRVPGQPDRRVLAVVDPVSPGVPILGMEAADHVDVAIWDGERGWLLGSALDVEPGGDDSVTRATLHLKWKAVPQGGRQ